jgi:hypothetical protein
MQIILNEQLTSTHNGHGYNLLNILSSSLTTHAMNKAEKNASYYPRFKAVDEVPKSMLINTGLVGLLSEAYKSHLKVAITPQDIWIVLISEIAKEVNTNPEGYRSLFTKSEQKEEISVPSGSSTHIPMYALSKALASKVLFDSNLLFPQFSTNTEITTEVLQAIFCDIASPYYNYSMFCCGIPAIKLLGTQEDWQNLQHSWNKLIAIFDTSTMKEYRTKVDNILGQINSTFTTPDGNAKFWMDIFTQKNVGSGGELTIDGWITELFVKKHSFAKITNFTSTHGIVTYTKVETKCEFYRIYGGFDMTKDSDEFHQLAYSSYVFEFTKEERK